ncbi:NTP transferase domain-containing protein [bacterium]|nr:NTP transferase domain-containing protein [bacterium]
MSQVRVLPPQPISPPRTPNPMKRQGPTAIVLAAGQGKRMKSSMPKVLTNVLGEPMINYVLNALQSAGIVRPTVVIGHLGEMVMNAVGERGEFSWQRQQLGTGHAVQCALPRLEGYTGDVVVTCGDTPLITGECYRRLVEERRRLKAAAVVATMVLEDPKSYGRIKRDASGQVTGIVEFKDASEGERAIREVNTGTYCFEAKALREAIVEIKNDNAQGEYYLTDTIAVLLEKKRSVVAMISPDPEEFLGVNDPADLVSAESRLSQLIKLRHMANGVILEDPATIRIEPFVEIGPRTRLRPGTILEGRTVVGADCVIGPAVTARNVTLPDNCHFGPHSIEVRAPKA